MNKLRKEILKHLESDYVNSGTQEANYTKSLLRRLYKLTSPSFWRVMFFVAIFVILVAGTSIGISYLVSESIATNAQLGLASAILAEVVKCEPIELQIGNASIHLIAEECG